MLSGHTTDRTFYAEIHASPDEEDWEDEAVWRRCNPMLAAGILDIDDFRRAHRQAKRIPSAKRAFLRLRLNRWVALDEAWLNPVVWDENGAEVAPLDPLKEWSGRACWAGLDLSRTEDFTALAWIFPRDDGGYDVWVEFFYPKDALPERRERREDIEDWARAGFIKLLPGGRIDYGAVAHALRRGCEAFDVKEIGYDPWNAPNVIREDCLSDVPVTMTKVAQYNSVMNAPCRMLETLLDEGKWHHYGNPVLRWMAKNAAADENTYGYMRPGKTKSKDKIDGLTACLIALERAIAPQEKKGYAGVVAV